MTEENQNPQPNEALFDVVEKAVTTVKLPLVMRKSGDPLVIGECTVTKHDDHFEIYGRIDLEEAQKMGDLLTSGLVSAVSIGGIIDKNSAGGALINRLN